MTYVIAVIVGLIAIWLIRKWLKLSWFRAGTLHVINNDLSYKPAVPGLQGQAFNDVTKHFSSVSASVEDAAIAFMLVQLGALSEPLDKRSMEFAMEKLALMQALVKRGNADFGGKLIQTYLEGKQWYR